MAFATQFALSLELTNLVPMGIAAAGKAWDLMTTARDLRGSGSDIVTEEDMAGLLGRCFVQRNLASTFREVVRQSEREKSLVAGITLLGGPGPTLLRALRQNSETSYFAMVVQCESFQPAE